MSTATATSSQARTTRAARLLMFQRGWQQKDLADALGWDPSKVSRRLAGGWTLDYLTARRRTIEAASLAVEVSNLRAFFAWCVAEGIRADSPMTLVPRPRTPRRLPRPIPDDELARALATANHRLRRVLLLAAYAGLRACEIAQLRGEAVMLDHDPPLLVIETSKGGGMTTVPLHPVLVADLRSVPPHGWLFPRANGTGHTSAWWISQWANAHLRASGSSSTLHALRHWFGTELHRATGDIRKTQEGMRHASPVSTALYSFVTSADVAEAVAALPVAG